MAKVLLISTKDVKEFTAISGNLDDNKFIQCISIAQDIHIENYLGTDLLTTLQTKIENNDLTDQYETLVNKYCKPILIHFAMVEYLPFGAYTIANKGIYKHTSENATNVEKNEVDMLIQKEHSIADGYVKRMIKYLCKYKSLFPEYKYDSENEINPDTKSNYGGWYL